MSDPTADLTATVEYTMDKWLVDRVPWGLWAAVAGLAVVLHTDSHGGSGAAVALAYMALLALAFAGYASTRLLDRTGLPFVAILLLSLVIVFVAAFVIAVAGGALGSSPRVGRPTWTGMVNPPPNAFGWMLIYLGLGWAALAAVRHVVPARPIVTLTPRGVGFHRPWLRDVVIPWQDIEGVGPPETTGPGGGTIRNPNAVAVVVGHDFYARCIVPKRSAFEPPGTDVMFQPKRDQMQIVLTSADVTVAPADYLAPIAARWAAFRDRPRSVVPSVAPSALPATPRIVHGRWSFDGTLRQALWFLAPLAGLAAVLLHASGTLPL
jgi:hypothetical protein